MNLYVFMRQLRDGSEPDIEKIKELRKLILSEDFQRIFEYYAKNEVTLIGANQKLYSLISELFLSLTENETDDENREENVRCLKILQSWVPLIEKQLS